jgi:hypothetical protein
LEKTTEDFCSIPTDYFTIVFRSFFEKPLTASAVKVGSQELYIQRGSRYEKIIHMYTGALCAYVVAEAYPGSIRL